MTSERKYELAARGLYQKVYSRVQDLRSRDAWHNLDLEGCAQEDWRKAVTAEETLSGYWAWVEHELELAVDRLVVANTDSRKLCGQWRKWLKKVEKKDSK